MKYKKNGVIMETNLETGLSTEEAEKRKKQIQKRETNLLQEIKNDRLLQMLMICDILYMIMLIIAIIWKYYFFAVQTIICCLLVSLVILLDICSRNKGIHSRDLYYKKISKENIEVIRDGKKQKVKKDDVTIGDIIVLEKGMKTDFSGVIIKGEVYIYSEFMRQKYKKESLKSETDVMNIDLGDDFKEESFIRAGGDIVCSGFAYMIVTYLLGEEIN